MAVAETNKIITHGDGQSIATSIQNIANAINDQEKNVHLSDTQTITGAKTFTSPIKTSEIDNASGNAMLRDKSTEGAIVLGSSAKKAVIMGSGDRPTYSKDGSDFTGSELALKSDVNAVSDVYIPIQNPDSDGMLDDVSALAGKNVYVIGGAANTNKQITSARTMFGWNECRKMTIKSIPSLAKCTDCSYMFVHSGWLDLTAIEELDLSSCTSTLSMFQTKGGDRSFGYVPLLKNTAKVTNWQLCYGYNGKLTEIGAVDMSGGTNLTWTFASCTGLTAIHAYGMKVSFDISKCTALQEAALVEIIGNIADVTGATTAPTLTMGTTLLGRLTSVEKQVAIDKGWNLA